MTGRDDRAQPKVRVQRSAVVTSHRRTSSEKDGGKLWMIVWQDNAGKVGESRALLQRILPPIGFAIIVDADPTDELPPVWDGEWAAR